MAFTLLVDTAQKRIAKGLMTLNAIGFEQFKRSMLTNMFVDPITGTVMRRPYQAEESFYTSNSGNYAKLGKADFSFTTAANWEDRYDGFATGPAICSLSSATSSDRGVSVADYPQNVGWFVAFYAYGTGSNFQQFECGWRTSGSGLDSGMGLRFYAGGDVEVWKDGSLVGTGKISGAGSGSETSGAWVGVYILPHRGRELLVFSNQGDGFTHAFTDLPQEWDATGDEEIIPAGKFWWGMANGGASVVLAPLTFPATGTLVTEEGYFPEKWDDHTGAETYEYIGWKPAACTETIDVSRVPGSDDGGEGLAGKIQIDITGGDDQRVGQIFGVVAGKLPDTQDTDSSEEQDLGLYLLGTSLDVPDDPAGVRVNATVKNLTGVEAVVAGWSRPMNRAVRLMCNDDDVERIVVDGVIDEASWSVSPNSEVEIMELAIRDRWAQLENALMRTEYPLDKLEFSAALGLLLEFGGCGDLIGTDIETTLYYLPGDTTPDGNGWSLLVRQGDNPGQWIKQICQDYAAPFFYGIKPTASGPKFFFTSPTTLDAQVPDVTLYASDTDAIAAGVAEADAWKQVYRRLKIQPLEPEANEIWITGWDRRRNRAIQSMVRYADLQDATLPPSARPEGWAGEPRLFGLVDSAIGNQDMADRTAVFMAEVLAANRTIYEWDSELLLNDAGYPLWRGDKVTLDGFGDVIITALRSNLIYEGGEPYRATTYTAVSKLGRPTFGRNMDEIVQELRMRGRRNVIVRAGSEFLQKTPRVMNHLVAG